MKKSISKKIFIILSLYILMICFTYQRSIAAVSPVAVSIIPPVQFPPDDFTLTGIRASILWGQHRDLYGIDLGVLGNITEQSFVGIGIAGGANITKGSTTILGLQLAGIANVNTNKTNVVGLQVALGTNYNSASSSITGLQFALLANISPFTDIYGVQLGLYNKAKDVYGFQIGLINVTENLHGIQIGLVNFNNKGGPFLVSPLLNVGF